VIGTRWLLAAAVVLPALGLLGAAGLELLSASRHLTDARQVLLLASGEAQAGQLAQARQHLAAGRVELAAARRVLDANPEVKLLGFLPIARQNLRAIRSSVDLAFQLTDGGLQLLDTAKPLEGPTGKIQLSLQSGAVPLQTVAALRDQLSQLLITLPAAGEKPNTRFVLGPVASSQRRIYAEAAARRRQFVPLSRTLDLLSDVAGANGPRRYLIAVANSAEMRGTGGMILSYGTISAADGKITLDKFGNIDELRLTEPAAITPTPDYVKRFGEFAPTLFWRNANIGGDFASAAPVMEAMYLKATGNRVDGVVQVDPMGLASLLGITGPVNVADVGEVNANNVVALTLNQVYARFPDRSVRQEYTGQVAEATFKALLSGSFGDLRNLGTNVNRASRQGNVIFHSVRSAAQRAAVGLGIAGLAPDAPASAQLTVQNLTGHKVDYYLDSALRLRGTWVSRSLGRVRAEIQLNNTSPPNPSPASIFGPALPSFKAGEYQALVSLYLPAGTTVRGSTGLDAPGSLTVSAENGRTVVSFRSTLPAAQSRTYSLDVILPPQPPNTFSLQLVPNPRVRPTTYAVDLTTDRGRLVRAGTLLTPTVLRK
jgi:hypothetical protein